MGYWRRLWILLLAAALPVTGNDSIGEDRQFSEKVINQRIVLREDVPINTGLITSPGYPNNFTTTESTYIKLVHVNHEVLLEIELEGPLPFVLPSLLVSNFSADDEPMGFPITRRVMSIECYTVHLPASENHAAFSLRYTSTKLHQLNFAPRNRGFSAIEQKVGSNVGMGRGRRVYGQYVDIGLEGKSGAVISNFYNYNVREDAAPYTFNSSENVTDDSSHMRGKLSFKNTKCTDVILSVKVVKLDLVPCDADNDTPRYSCEGPVIYPDELGGDAVPDPISKMFISTMSFTNSHVQRSMYEKCYRCGSIDTLNRSLTEFNLTLHGFDQDKSPIIGFKVHNGPSVIGFLLKYEFIGCPWEGRNFLNVSRIGFSNSMVVECKSGYKLYDEGHDIDDYFPECLPNATWIGNPRCIPANSTLWNIASLKSTSPPSDEKVFEAIISPITAVLFIVLVTLSVIVLKQRAQSNAGMSETSSEIEDKSGRNDCEISDVMIEVDDLTEDMSYLNVAMDDGQQKTCVEIHRTVDDEKHNNNTKQEAEKKSITISFKRPR